jgi:hypothetical protein
VLGGVPLTPDIGFAIETIPLDEESDIFLYKMETSPISNFTLLPVRFGAAGSEADIGFIHPNFAKAVYPTGSPAPTAGTSFSIRTPQQMLNINDVLSLITPITFTQERNLDFESIHVITSVIDGVFNGTFDGGEYNISNVTVDATANTIGTPVQTGGLFSESGASGVIRNVNVINMTLNNVAEYDSTPSEIYPGAVVGINNIGGIVDNCTVETSRYSFSDVPGTYVPLTYIIGWDMNLYTPGPRIFMDELDGGEEELNIEIDMDETDNNELTNEELTSNKTDAENDDDDSITAKDGADDSDPMDLSVQSDFGLQDSLIVTINIITLFGGYGFTKTRIFKGYLRKSNARAIRSINEYNDRKRSKRQ